MIYFYLKHVYTVYMFPKFQEGVVLMFSSKTCFVPLRFFGSSGPHLPHMFFLGFHGLASETPTGSNWCCFCVLLLLQLVHVVFFPKLEDWN